MFLSQTTKPRPAHRLVVLDFQKVDGKWEKKIYLENGKRYKGGKQSKRSKPYRKPPPGSFSPVRALFDFLSQFWCFSLCQDTGENIIFWKWQVIFWEKVRVKKASTSLKNLYLLIVKRPHRGKKVRKKFFLSGKKRKIFLENGIVYEFWGKVGGIFWTQNLGRDPKIVVQKNRPVTPQKFFRP